MQNKIDLRRYIPYLTAIVLFIVLALAFLPQVIEGKQLMQHDHQSAEGNAKEIRDYREATGKEALWTNSLFGGMPAYLISTRFPSNLISAVDNLLKVGPGPVGMLFILMLGFYILLVVLKVNPWLSIPGAFAFAFASFNIIIIMVGHNSQAVAIAYMAPTLAGILLAFRGKKWLGGALTALFLSLEILAGHPQISYYLLLIVLILGISEFIFAIKSKSVPEFLKTVGILSIAAILAVASNFGRLYTTYEYGNYSMRAKSELTGDQNDQTSGLPRSYITGWSYGKKETLTLLIPGFRGGSNNEPVSENSATYKLFAQNNPAQAKEISKSGLPLYWGDQPGTSGPVYLGAMVIFLFLLGMFIVDNRYRWWILAATVLGIFLSWGKYFPFLTNFFVDHVPGYNKFRTVSMALVIAGLTMPLLAFLALKESLYGNVPEKKFNNALKWSFGITAGIALLFTIAPGLAGSFIAPSDSHYQQILTDAFREDRRSLLRADAFRSFLFITLSAGVILIARMKKLKLDFALIILGLLFLIDLWPVDKRYLNETKFVSKRNAGQFFTPTTADKMILTDKSLDYRVANLTVSTFSDASTSYFHKSIGGYHGAKMRRYQDLIDNELTANLMTLVNFLQNPSGFNPDSMFQSLNVLNMLNTKYIILNPQGAPLQNNMAAGNAWFVGELIEAENADEEMALLKTLDIKHQASVDVKFRDYYTELSYPVDSSAKIKLISYSPNELKYTSSTNAGQLAVFSEIYYEKGWKAYIDDQPAPHFRVDYLLRAMNIPAGEHEIVFRFHPESYFMGEKVSLAGSLMIILLLLGVVVFELKGKKEKDQ
ncbi:MAG: YfhO family protein [Bacteroidota bacterium]